MGGKNNLPRVVKQGWESSSELLIIGLTPYMESHAAGMACDLMVW